jgi:hypothetical protein
VSSAPNAFQNAEVAKLTAADRERDLRQRTEKVKETLESLADNDRKRLDGAKIQFGCAPRRRLRGPPKGEAQGMALEERNR